MIIKEPKYDWDKNQFETMEAIERKIFTPIIKDKSLFKDKPIFKPHRVSNKNYKKRIVFSIEHIEKKLQKKNIKNKILLVETLKELKKLLKIINEFWESYKQTHIFVIENHWINTDLNAVRWVANENCEYILVILQRLEVIENETARIEKWIDFEAEKEYEIIFPYSKFKMPKKDKE